MATPPTTQPTGEHAGPPAGPPAGRKPNRLIHETSPYLLQRAHNPVDWYPWGSRRS